MHLKGLDLNLLVVLDALLAEKNITRTGERIYLSQSATSSALARLREFFGDPLLIQVGQKMQLTPMAERLAQPVHELIVKGEAIIDKNQGFRPDTSTRTFRMNMSDYASAVIMSRVLSRIHQLAPGVRLEITTIMDEPTSEYLERGNLDLIVTTSEMSSPNHPRENLLAVVWSENPLAQEELTLERYLSAAHIVARFANGWAHDEVFIARSCHQRRIDVVASSFSMLIHQVVGTHLIATIQERFARHHAQHLPLRIFPCPIPVPPLQVQIQWHRFHSADPGVLWLREVLQEAAQGLEPLSGTESATASPAES